MFGWFRPTCPVDAAAKAWIEQRLAWLGEEFGLRIFVERPVILPTHEFFPDPYDGSEASIRALLDRVCGYMHVDPLRVEMELFSNNYELGLVNDAGKLLPTDAAGWYDEAHDKFQIRLDANQIDEPMTLVGTMAHELSHARLRGERRVVAESYDEELLTDLTTVFHGFGVFLANIPRNWDSMYTEWPDTELKKPEYMTLPMYGYALAHQAWFRDEPRPDWMRHLRLDARAVLKQGLQYLMRTGDSSFRPPKYSTKE